MLRDLHVARLEHQWEQTMLAWHRSTQAEEIEKVVGEEGGKRKAEKTRRSQTGDVKYLIVAREIMAEIRELTAANSVATPHLEEPDVESLTLEQRQAALDHLLETLVRRAGAAENGGTVAGEEAAA